MPGNEADIIVIGAGAAGIAAARQLQADSIDTIVIEARTRPGGRAWTMNEAGTPMDLGCGWLHSADRNPWTTIAHEQNRTIDKSPPPWSRDRAHVGPHARAMSEFTEAMGCFREQTDAFKDDREDVAASNFLEPNNPWNPLIDAVSTYYSGAPLDWISTQDLARYDDSGINWRIAEGYGTVIAEHATPLRIEFDCEAIRIDHAGQGVAVETTRGTFRAKGVIITLSSDILAESANLFSPALPDKCVAAANLPLGLADKLYLSLPEAAAFEFDTRAFGKTDTVDTAAYHFRPMGRPIIEAYFGGHLAEALEHGGTAAFFDFARSELSQLFGAEFAAALEPIVSTAWRRDRWAKGSYSYARPGYAKSRELLGAAVNDTLFFAGEACSPTDFSTAHGAYLTGVDAANQASAMLRKVPHRFVSPRLG